MLQYHVIYYLKIEQGAFNLGSVEIKKKTTTSTILVLISLLETHIKCFYSKITFLPRFLEKEK